MAALLLHDLTIETGPKNPKNRKTFGVENTLELFRSQAVSDPLVSHHGMYRVLNGVLWPDATHHTRMAI
jgi:hypothetical protein